MKQVHANYTFNPLTKTITLTGLNIAQNQLLLVTNATRGVIYYNFASSSHRATVTAGDNTTVVLTDASTNGHDDYDRLTIYYDDKLNIQTVTGTTASLDYLTEAIATASALSNASLTDIATFDLKDNTLAGSNNNFLSGPKNLAGAIVVIPYIPFGSMSGLVRFASRFQIGYGGMESGGKLADGTTPSYIDSSVQPNFPPLFFPPNTRTIFIKKVNEQGAVSGAGINSTQDFGFMVYRAPSVDYNNPPYSLTIASETKNAVGNKSESAAATDTGTFSLISLFKRLLSRITTLVPANLTVASTRLLVDGSGVTQPVSGTVTANAGTGTFAVSAASLPLPTGAATSANQTTANTSLSNIDTKIPSLSSGRIPVDGSGVTQPVSAGALGTTSDANAGTFNGNFSIISLAKYIANLLVVLLDSRNPANGTLTFSSYSIVASNTNEAAYTVTGRKYYLELKNASSNVMYINFGAAASASTYRLNANEKIVFDSSFVPSGEVRVFGSSGDKLHILVG